MDYDCSILLNDETSIDDITICTSQPDLVPALKGHASLRFLSFVEISRIPLCLAVGSPCRVYTSNSETQQWFRDTLLSTEADESEPWWQLCKSDSPLGVLVAVPECDDNSQTRQPRVTELLFYASASTDPCEERFVTPPSPPPQEARVRANSQSRSKLSVHVLPLSSDLLYRLQADVSTPPASPVKESGDSDAVFLSQPFLNENAVVNVPPIRKRKSANDVFDEASERRKKARRKGGEGVSAAAAVNTQPQVPSLQHRRSMSITQTNSTVQRSSRSPSLGPSRPTTAASTAPRKSTLSRVQSVTSPTQHSDIEKKNKETVSRIVMAGMRLYGLSQSKGRKRRASSAAPSPTVEMSFDDREAERRNDEEFKLIYHQVYKGTCFAFRRVVAEKALQPFSEAIRDVADRMLSIFCSNPLTAGSDEGLDQGLRGGRDVFCENLQQSGN